MFPDLISAEIRRLPLNARERQAAAELLRLQAAGERVAMAGARGQARIAPTRTARRFLIRQSRQEAFHARLFTHAACLLDDSAPEPDDIPLPLMRVRKSLADAIVRSAYVEAVLIQHIALEGLGNAVLQRLDEELPVLGSGFDRLRRIILEQEGEHCRFGARVLAQHADVPQLAGVGQRMLDEAEALLILIAPQFRTLGGDVGDIIEPMRAGAFAAVGAAT